MKQTKAHFQLQLPAAELSAENSKFRWKELAFHYKNE